MCRSCRGDLSTIQRCVHASGADSVAAITRISGN